MLRTLPVLAVFLATLLPGLASAATFRLGGDESLDCRMTIEGEIVEGDAERFRQMLVDYLNDLLPQDPNVDLSTNYHEWMEEVRICLDSPGGSISEAIEMADTLAYGYRVRSDITPHVPGLAQTIIWTIGTAVPAGARCESACAILFMAGGYFSQLGTSNNGRDPNRILHVDGRLGFHAPSLVVPGGDYTEDTVSQAFGLAVETIQRLSNRLDRYNFSPSLFQRMVSTAPDDMFYVDTVEEAASWFIPISGAPVIDDPSLGNLTRVCENLTALSDSEFAGGAQYSLAGAPAAIRAETAIMFGLAPRLGFNNSYYWEWGLPDGVDTKLTGTVLHEENDCSFEYDTSTGHLRIIELPITDHGLRATGTFEGMIPWVDNYAWLLYPGYTTLEALSALARDHRSGRIPGDTPMSVIVDHMTGFCATYDATDRLQQSSACTAMLTGRQRADRRAHTDTLIVDWPDGLSTALPSGLNEPPVQRIGDWEYLDFAVSGREWISPTAYDFNAPAVLNSNGSSEVGGCYRSGRTGETRCFILNQVVETDLSAFRR